MAGYLFFDPSYRLMVGRTRIQSTIAGLGCFSVTRITWQQNYRLNEQFRVLSNADAV